MDWYVQVMSNYAAFKGRARRTEQWMFLLLFSLCACLWSIATQIVDAALGTGLMLLFLAAHVLPLLAVVVRRLHDTDRSAWWLLLGVVPVLGIVLLGMTLLRGTPAPNRFGPDPRLVD